MTTDLIVSERFQDTEVGLLAEIADRANEFVNQAKAQNTVRAYQSDWTHFEGWCGAHSVCSLPATTETVAFYLTDLSSTLKTGTLVRRISAISQAHQIAGFETPTRSSQVRLVMAGIRRTNGTAQVAKTPVLVEDLRRMVSKLPKNLLGVRDRALLLVGFSGAFRRSELVAVDVADATITRDGIVINIRRSKADQDGQGRKIGIPYGSNPATCPVALQDWLGQCGFTEGSLFRPIDRFSRVSPQRLSGAAIADIVKRYVEAAGLDATNFAGHSLRSGLATSAAAAGASERSIMNQTGHRSVVMVRRYIRDGSLFRENAAAKVGL
jgi:site-specific recombinase XerD